MSEAVEQWLALRADVEQAVEDGDIEQAAEIMARRQQQLQDMVARSQAEDMRALMAIRDEEMAWLQSWNQTVRRQHDVLQQEMLQHRARTRAASAYLQADQKR